MIKFVDKNICFRDYKFYLRFLNIILYRLELGDIQLQLLLPEYTNMLNYMNKLSLYWIVEIPNC
jgi:hypothetical protein